MNIVQYTKAASLEEAWELNQGRGAVVLGGCCCSACRPNGALLRPSTCQVLASMR